MKIIIKNIAQIVQTERKKTSFVYGDNMKKLNVIDTPGYLDFQGEVKAALHIADFVAVVINAVNDPPTIQLPVILENQIFEDQEFFIDGISLFDVDVADNVMLLTVEATNGTVSLNHELHQYLLLYHLICLFS